MADINIQKITDAYTNGYSDVEVCKELGVTLKQFSRLYDTNDAFAQLVDYGRTLAHAWWMSKARVNLNDKTFNTALFVMVMKNRYGWADKIDSSINDPNESLSAKDLYTRLKKDLPKLLAQLGPDLADSKALEVLAAVEDEQAD